ncbi:MAG: hypothetical protein V7782_01230 [Psychromonas sp.]
MKKSISLIAAVIISMSLFISPVSAFQTQQTLQQQAVFHDTGKQTFIQKRCSQGCAH